jgi:hypothetical protein
MLPYTFRVGREPAVMILIEPALATLLMLASALILRAVWKADASPALVARPVRRPEPVPDYRKAA